METNLPLIIGLASGFSFLNFLMAFTWFLWERNRRRNRNQRQPEDKLTSLIQRPVKLHKRRRPQTMTNAISETCDRYSAPPRNDLSHRSMYISSPLPVHQSPIRSAPPPGLSSLRNELYPPPPMSITREASARTYDTASIYSTVSAPSHLHEEILSETHESFSTAVNSEDDHYMIDKYNGVSEEEHSTAMDRRDPLYAIQAWEPETLDRNHPPRWSRYLADDARSGTPPMLVEPTQQWQTSYIATRRAPSVPPLNIRKHRPTLHFATPRQAPPPRCLSPRLTSPYSP